MAKRTAIGGERGKGRYSIMDVHGGIKIRLCCSDILPSNFTSSL